MTPSIGGFSWAGLLDGRVLHSLRPRGAGAFGLVRLYYRQLVSARIEKVKPLAARNFKNRFRDLAAVLLGGRCSLLYIVDMNHRYESARRFAEIALKRQ